VKSVACAYRPLQQPNQHSVLKSVGLSDRIDERP